MPLKRTHSVIFELGFANEQSESATPTNLQTSSTTSTSMPYPLSPSLASVDNSASSQWISLPPPAMHAVCVLPRSLYGANQQTSPLGPNPRKLYRRVFLHSGPKPNLYRQVLIARAKKAAKTSAL
jgi:hypothetical protein